MGCRPRRHQCLRAAPQAGAGVRAVPSLCGKIPHSAGLQCECREAGAGGGGKGCEGAPGRPWLICCAWGWTAGRRARRAGGCAGQQEVGLVSLELRSRGVGEEGLVAGVGLAGVGQEC